jgi:hypothetical protein
MTAIWRKADIPVLAVRMVAPAGTKPTDGQRQISIVGLLVDRLLPNAAIS